jgi:methionyl-tRNA formyltransferase
MGTAEVACASLETLARDPRFHVVAVATQPDKPRGRNLKLQPSPVKVLAEKLQVPVWQPVRARDEQFIGELRALKPDLIAVAAYGQILPPAILELPRHGCVNVHTSLLPKYRGAAPIQWAIANGDAETGVTLMKMDAGLDTGPILSVRRTPISTTDDAQTLHARLAQLGAELLAQTIPDYVAGKIQPQPQPAEGASHAPKIKKEDGRIDWSLPAEQILNRIRAFTPWPGAFTLMLGPGRRASAPEALPPRTEAGTPGRPAPPKHLLKIWKAEVVGKDSRKDALPGEIFSTDKNCIYIACGKNALRILELQLEGGKRLTAEQFISGHSVRVGDKFTP